jgi:hypothetical protein
MLSLCNACGMQCLCNLLDNMVILLVETHVQPTGIRCMQDKVMRCVQGKSTGVCKERHQLHARQVSSSR